jgi:protein TonB
LNGNGPVPARPGAPGREIENRKSKIENVARPATEGPRILDLPAPEYPLESRRHGEAGLVVLEVEVLPSGRAGTVRARRSPGFALAGPGFRRLAAAAEAAVRRARFAPAMDGGRPVRAVVVVPFRFELE